ncbi:hypothetical protein SAMD00019534_104110, partial [Acytostelium subglobosum LB1]|uniref:hypothetical protein n=1 Tax=Acytostelium subglobosum LB1 TaxID=1410327 RepID=UPI000644C860
YILIRTVTEMKTHHLIFLVISFLWLFGMAMYLINTSSSTVDKTISDKPVYRCEHMDIVYTWVNGSDPKHIKSRIERSGGSKYAAPGNNRFRDLMGLKYSLRSLKKFAPWVRRVFVVSDNQYPQWFNESSEDVRFIFHQEFFKNLDDLPTFNSNAIETNFYNLPDFVSDCFVYFNDDIFVGSPVEMKDFWDPVYGQAIYKSGWTAPQPEAKLKNIWHACIKYSNELLNGLWGVDNSNRHYSSHGTNTFNKNILKMMQHDLPAAFELSSSHPFRTAQDLQMPFLHLQYVLRYYATFEPSPINYYALLSDDLDKVKYELKRIKSIKPKTVCLNDGLSVDNPNMNVIEELRQFFEDYFPDKPSWE